MPESGSVTPGKGIQTERTRRLNIMRRKKGMVTQGRL
jgi:hypothetical protein